MGSRRPAIVVSMKRQMIRATAALGGMLAAGVFLGGPAQADPPAGDATTVVMQLPGPASAPSPGAAESPYAPPRTTLTVQDTDGAGVDRDGTDGFINTSGIDGTVSGPLMTADPQVRADPAPLAAGALPLPV